MIKKNSILYFSDISSSSQNLNNWSMYYKLKNENVCEKVNY